MAAASSLFSFPGAPKAHWCHPNIPSFRDPVWLLTTGEQWWSEMGTGGCLWFGVYTSLWMHTHAHVCVCVLANISVWVFVWMCGWVDAWMCVVVSGWVCTKCDCTCSCLRMCVWMARTGSKHQVMQLHLKKNVLWQIYSNWKYPCKCWSAKEIKLDQHTWIFQCILTPLYSSALSLSSAIINPLVNFVFILPIMLFTLCSSRWDPRRLESFYKL